MADPGFDLPAFAKAITPILEYYFTVRIVPEIPRAAEGKIRRTALQQALVGAPPAMTARSPRDLIMAL